MTKYSAFLSSWMFFALDVQMRWMFKCVVLMGYSGMP